MSTKTKKKKPSVSTSVIALLILLFIVLIGAMLALGVYMSQKSREEQTDTYRAAQLNLDQIKLEDARKRKLTGKGVRIAVIDTGVVQNHEDLDYERISGFSYIGDGTDYSDSIGHGSFVVGMLAARSDNGLGIAGMTESDIVVIKVMDEGATISAVTFAKAIRDAVDVYDCSVINISAGTKKNVASLREAVEYALSKGAILVAAAGTDGESEYYPAAYDSVVGVGSLTTELEPLDDTDNSSVFVTAPGEGLISLGIVNKAYETDGAGASYAAAHVTAAAAIAKQADPEMTAQEFMELLRSTAADRGESGWDSGYGWGVLDLSTLTKAVKGG